MRYLALVLAFVAIAVPAVAKPKLPPKRLPVWIPEGEWNLTALEGAEILAVNQQCKQAGNVTTCTLRKRCEAAVVISTTGGAACNGVELQLRKYRSKDTKRECLKVFDGPAKEFAYTRLASRGAVGLLAHRSEETLEGSHYFYGLWEIDGCSARKIVEFEAPSPKNGPWVVEGNLAAKEADEQCRTEGTADCSMQETKKVYLEKLTLKKRSEAEAIYRAKFPIRPTIVWEKGRWGIQQGEKNETVQWFKDLKRAKFEWEPAQAPAALPPPPKEKNAPTKTEIPMAIPTQSEDEEASPETQEIPKPTPVDEEE